MLSIIKYPGYILWLAGATGLATTQGGSALTEHGRIVGGQPDQIISLWKADRIRIAVDSSSGITIPRSDNTNQPQVLRGINKTQSTERL